MLYIHFIPTGQKKMDPKALENMVGHVDPATMDKFTDADFERLIKKVKWWKQARFRCHKPIFSLCNSILFYFILFYFVLFYFILFYFILFYFILFYFILFYFILFYFILFYFILFYFILFYFTLFYFILFYFILFYFIFIFFIRPSLIA